MTLTKACKELSEELEKAEISLGAFPDSPYFRGYRDALKKFQRWLFSLKGKASLKKESLDKEKLITFITKNMEADTWLRDNGNESDQHSAGYQSAMQNVLDFLDDDYESFIKR